MNQNIEAVGFDLFHTLITVDDFAGAESLRRLTESLRADGLVVDQDAFVQAHREAALWFLEKTREDGRETHNRFWISAALNELGYRVPPEDPRIAEAVDAYFSAYIESCRLIPGTTEMLDSIKGRYRLGLLSNFTHGPAARKVIDGFGLAAFFDVLLISGEVGYRKPHIQIFQKFVEELGVRSEQIAFVGDDSEADISGAYQAGLRPIWTTYVQDKNISSASGLLARKDHEPHYPVPRISNWKDLFVLLGVE